MSSTAVAATVNVAAIPDELCCDAQWLVWRWETRDSKLTKPPYNARTGGAGSSTDSSTWSTFSEACAALTRGNDGIGYVLRPDSGIAGIDLDDCVDPETHAIDAWALDVVERVDSYTEVSPSGRGLRIFLRGALPGSGHKKGLHARDAERYPRTKAAIEVYDQGRYLTVTGQHVDWTPRVLKKRQDAFRAIHDEFWPAAPETPVVQHQPSALPVDLDDAQLLEVAFHAKNGADIRALYDGATSAHGDDESSADLALLNHLAFYTGRDAARMERLFDNSALGQRDKWRKRPDYRDRSMQKSIASCTTTYRGTPARHFDDVADDDDDSGRCSNCARLERKLAELQARFDWQNEFRRKKQFTAGDKLVVDALAEVHAYAETTGGIERIDGIECIPIIIEASPDNLERHPERATWTDRTLTGRTALSRSTIKRSIDRLTNETNGAWGLYSKPVENKDGLWRPRLYLVPKASAAETRAAVLDFEPPEAEAAKPKTPKLIRCKHHPMARVNEDTTWKCHLCGRHCQPARRHVIDPGDYVPGVQNDELVTGEAELGPAPGRDLWSKLPAIQNDELGALPAIALSPVDNDARQNGTLAPSYWPVYDRVPLTDQAPVPGEHCCQDCGAFSDVQWGPVVECGPPGRQVWLHAGADAPCRMPVAVAS